MDPSTKPSLFLLVSTVQESSNASTRHNYHQLEAVKPVQARDDRKHEDSTDCRQDQPLKTNRKKNRTQRIKKYENLNEN